MTRIPFEVKKRYFVTIAIYDILGNRVRQLVHEEKPAGKYEVAWDGTDQSGISVASGTYFYRMIIGNFSQTKKLTLTR